MYPAGNASVIPPERFLTDSLRSSPWGGSMTRVMAAAIRAAEPATAVKRFLHRTGDTLYAGERSYQLKKFEHIYLIGAGKAGAPMAEAVIEILPNRIAAGAIIVKYGYAQSSPELRNICQVIEAGHPIPDQQGVAGAQEILRILSGANENDLFIFLISGGGSALLTAPAPGITLEQIQNLTDELLRCGASIQEINILRKHLDVVKGGGMAAATSAQIVSLVLSDVVGDPLDLIASGPTAPDTSCFHDAWDTLAKYHLQNKVPRAICDRILQGIEGKIPENPHKDHVIFNKVHHVIVGNNYLAGQAALNQAQEEGYKSLFLSSHFQGEARELGRFIAAVAQQVHETGQPISKPACIVAGGEATVTLHGSGKGGRNQEIALSAVDSLAGLPGVTLVTLATDGGDGPTDAAGAVVTGTTLERALAAGLRLKDHLDNNDSYHFFAELGDLLKPGPTQTNVNDLILLFIK